ncbi:hypothetical protein [Streptococcus plurextorum]|uniref:hypothetical protein n=1 Tax=Streptococcus plurextorum TaxID=456876 RepID=UPI0004147D21|nr:hypothetical protein [Streptococcus plurextorum]
MSSVWTFKENEDYHKLYDCAVSPEYVDSLWIYQGFPLKEDEEDKDWKEPSFSIQYGDFPDFILNDCQWILCSERLKDCISKNISDSKVKWLPIKVINGDTFCRYYSMLIEDFFKEDIIVNHEMSRKLKNGEIYLPIFIYNRIKNLDLFVVQNDGIHIFISDKLKKVLEVEKFKGLGFEQWEVK